MTSEERIAITQGLRDLAEFLDTHPELPLPQLSEVHYSVIADTDDIERAEIDRIAEILGVSTETSSGGAHYTASLRFGPVVYRAVAITQEHMARSRAGATYIDVVTPEEWPI